MSLPPHSGIERAPGVAFDAADRLLEALTLGDAVLLERELALEVCAWWRDGSRLESLVGSALVARALVETFREHGADRFVTRATSEGSVLVSALEGGRLAWSLELRPTGGRFTGAILRGVARPR